jgi:hypothetical protein
MEMIWTKDAAAISHIFEISGGNKSMEILRGCFAGLVAIRVFSLFDLFFVEPDRLFDEDSESAKKMHISKNWVS